MLSGTAGLFLKASSSNTPAGSEPLPTYLHINSRSPSSKPLHFKPGCVTTSPLAQEWTELVDDLIYCVVDKLDRPSVRCVRLVCKHWRLAVDKTTEAVCLKSPNIKRLAARFPGLKSLDLSACRNLRNYSVSQLAQSGLAHNLQSLQIGSTDIPYIHRSFLTDEALGCLLGLPSLSSLSLCHCASITNTGLQLLKCLTTLTALTVLGCPRISDSGTQVVQELHGLRRLALSGHQVTDITLAQVASLPHLLSLHLCGCGVSEKGVIRHVAAIRSLQELVLSWTSVSYSMLTTLAGLPFLHSLSLLEFSGCCWSDAIMGCCGLTGLRRLHLHGVKSAVEGRISTVTQALVKSLPLLEDLSFVCRWGSGANELIHQLAKLPNLRRLGFGSPWGHWSSQLSALSCLTQLQAIQVKCAHMGQASWLHSLQLLPNLQELDLSHNYPPSRDSRARRPSPEVLNHLAACTSLRTLDLSFWSLKGPQLCALVERLPNLSHVRAFGVPMDSATRRRLDSLGPRVTVQCSDVEWQKQRQKVWA